MISLPTTVSEKEEKKNHYVDNTKFLAAMIEYRESVQNAQLQHKDAPRVPEYIGDCFLQIAKHLSYKPNFLNYTFREDMIADGVENCLQYINNFDPEKSSNPFAYFTQIIYYAFLRRIQKEKRQLYVKYKAMERSGIENTSPSGGPSAIHDNIYEFIETYEQNIVEQKKKAQAPRKKTSKKRKNGLEAFVDNSVSETRNENQ